MIIWEVGDDVLCFYDPKLIADKLKFLELMSFVNLTLTLQRIQ